MKRVLRTLVLSACAAAAVAYGGVHQDGDAPAPRAQPVPPLAELFRTGFGGGTAQSNDCDELFGSQVGGGGDSGGIGTTGASTVGFGAGGAGGMSLAAFSGAPGAARGCVNIRG
ncbi:hypothetical protein ABZ370_33540 [Streptomyces sp. NPDC005962]|uniref:hypothetical protein n=1 Tax=Streptomyces sp. NPDC005962 TaxID=3154466 RepID=UPI00340454E2